jgi:3-deoxy-D-manno-octulosonic-acid transferase
MTGSMARWAWSLAAWALTPLMLARYWWRGRQEPGYRVAWRERLGHLGGTQVPGAVWIHAVSLGETRAAAALIHALRKQHPGLRLVLTHTTATGREAGKTLLKEGDRQCWLPWDTPGATQRFLRKLRPSVGVLMETEIWPNLLHAAQRERVPMVLANARLSEKSARRGQRLASLFEPAMRSLALVLAQTADDARRLQDAGVADAVVGGNLKYDMTPSPALIMRGQHWREKLPFPVVMAASTREREELELLRLWSEMDAPRPLLLLVPRHPQRFEEVAVMVRDFGLALVRRSQWTDLPPQQANNADVWLGDSLGEMPLYYAMSDVALLGGSFAKLGGQNLIEAAACGCPIVMGPHTFNFAEAAELALAARAAIRVPDMGEGVERAVQLARDPERAQWGRRALAFAATHRGAAQRTARAVLEVAGIQASTGGGPQSTMW